MINICTECKMSGGLLTLSDPARIINTLMINMLIKECGRGKENADQGEAPCRVRSSETSKPVLSRAQVFGDGSRQAVGRSCLLLFAEHRPQGRRI